MHNYKNQMKKNKSQADEKSRRRNIYTYRYLFLCKSLLLISIFILILNNVHATVKITEINDPGNVDEGQNLDISFGAESNASDINYSIYMNGQLVSNENSYSKSMNYTSAGIYEFTFLAKDNESEAIETINVNVNDVPLSVEILSPQNKVYNQRNITISVSANHENVECDYSLNNNEDKQLKYDDSSDLFYESINLGSDGEFELSVICSDSAESVTKKIVFSVDTINLFVLTKSYSIDKDHVVTLNVETFQKSSCRYDVSDRDFNSMYNDFQNTGNMLHSTKIISAVDGINTYYIRCKDNNNNAMSYPEVISFNLIRKPNAIIKLSKSSPLKSGRYDVFVTTSKDVQTISLSYSLSNDASQKSVFLSGSGKEWKGYIIIDEDIDDSVGAFKLAATDFSGNTGNIITDGELFLVDTTAPSSASSLNSEIEKDGDIKIRWYHDGEDVDKFNIFRSDNEKVDYSDHYDSINFDIDDEYMYEYVDNDADYDSNYYYRVSAVDEAGNEGELSELISVYLESVNEDFNLPEKRMSPELLRKIDVQIQEIQTMILDLKSRNEEIDTIEDPAKIRIISMMGLNEKANQALDSYTSMLDELNSIKSQYMEKSELEVRLNKIRLDSIKAQSNIFEDIQVIEPGTYEQFTQESDIDEGIRLITEGINITKRVIDNYSLSNKRIQDNVIVKVEVYPFKIKYMNIEDYQKFTIIKKSVSTTVNSNLSDVVVLEIIPKEVERKASELIFFSNTPKILKEDPVLSWEHKSLSNTEFYYVVKNNIDLAAIKNTRTVILLKPEFKFSDTLNEPDHITGSIIGGSLTLRNLSLMHWIIIIGVGMILILSVYYVAILDNGGKNKMNKHFSHKIIRHKQNVNSQNNYLNINPVRTSLNNPQLYNSQVSKNQLANNSIRKNNQIMNNTLSNTRKNNSIANNNINTAKTTNINNASIQNVSTVLNASTVSLPEQVLMSKVFYCNSLINSFDYDNSKNVYKQCLDLYRTASFDNYDEKKKATDMLRHVHNKLDSYRHIHSARKHLYLKDRHSLNINLQKINQLYSNLAYNVGFIEHHNQSDELKFLQFVANSKTQLEKYS